MTKKELIVNLFLLGFELKETRPALPIGTLITDYMKPKTPIPKDTSIAIYVRGDMKVSLQYYKQEYNEHTSRYIGDIKVGTAKIAPFIDYDSVLGYVLKEMSND